MGLEEPEKPQVGAQLPSPLLASAKRTPQLFKTKLQPERTPVFAGLVDGRPDHQLGRIGVMLCSIFPSFGSPISTMSDDAHTTSFRTSCAAHDVALICPSCLYLIYSKLLQPFCIRRSMMLCQASLSSFHAFTGQFSPRFLSLCPSYLPICLSLVFVISSGGS